MQTSSTSSSTFSGVFQWAGPQTCSGLRLPSWRVRTRLITLIFQGDLKKGEEEQRKNEAFQLIQSTNEKFRKKELIRTVEFLVFGSLNS